MLLIVSESWF